MDNILEKLRERVFEISKKYNLSHVGSCISILPILFEVFSEKRPKDKVILSCGHAGVALYVILEHFYGLKAEELFKSMGVHPSFGSFADKYIHVSTGSLGMGFTVACGMASINDKITVYCILSDGEMAEGAVWESLAYAENNLPNLKIIVNANGYGATQKIDLEKLEARIKAFHSRVDFRKTYAILPFAEGLECHYNKVP
jgi:transketolase